MTAFVRWFAFVLFFCVPLVAGAIGRGDDTIAKLPPMGWRSWEAFYGNVDEKKMMNIMRILTDRSRSVDGVPTSLSDLGFTDVGLDSGFEDCFARTVGGKPAFHDPQGRPIINKRKFPSGLRALVDAGHKLNLTVSWYGNACACKSENSYSAHTQPTVQQAIHGTVAATLEYGFDGLKLDSCSQFNNMTEWWQLLRGHPVLVENCHQGGLVPGQRMPGQQCEGKGEDECPYHMFRTSDDIYNCWINAVNNINSVTPYLSQSDPNVAPRSRPGQWAYPDMLEVGNFGCRQGHSCKQTKPPLEDRSQFGMWAIVSSPLILSVDLSNPAVLHRVWPILSNREAIAINQYWGGSPGRLLLTDRVKYPGDVNSDGFIEYPGQLGQSRGWQNVMGMTGPPPWQVGPCVDEWSGEPCTRHYMTLHRANMTVAQADAWCKTNSSCEGFTFRTSERDAVTTCYFRDPTQIFFMDSQVSALSGSVHASQWTSHVSAARAPPLSPTTSGLQVWVKALSAGRLALLLVNIGQDVLSSYTLPLHILPLNTSAGVQVRDVWQHRDLPKVTDHLSFTDVQAHDSVFLVLSAP